MSAEVRTDRLLAVGRFFRAVDTRDWHTVGALLADRVGLDYTSVFGGETETVTNSELITRWRGLLPGFDATQHFLAQLLPTAEGTVECNVRAYHYLDDEAWMLAGWYLLTLQAGTGDEPVRIGGITLTQSYETGSRDLLRAAQERAAS